MDKMLRLKTARDYLVMKKRMGRKTAILGMRQNKKVARSSLMRYVAELRASQRAVGVGPLLPSATH